MDPEDIQTIPSIGEELDSYFFEFLKAVNHKNEDLMNLLISKDGILQKRFSVQKETLLHIIAQRGTVKTAAKMCELGSVINFPNKHGETPIFHGIRHSTEMMLLLINSGASLNIQCKKGVSPLQEALYAGSVESVKIILNRMITRKRKLENYMNPMDSGDFITVHSSEQIVRALLEHREDLFLNIKDSSLLIFFAAKVGNLDLLKLTVEHCLSLDKKTYNKHLQEKEINFPQGLNIRGFFSRTALHYAVKQQLPEVVLFLLEAGANVNCETCYEYTPLHYAAHLENSEICEILLSFGAKVSFLELRNPPLPRLNPLHLVCGRNETRNLSGFEDCYCYEEYYDLAKAQNLDGQTIFNLKIMKLLLQNEANPDIPFSLGMSPFLEACRVGLHEPMKLLLEFDANIETCDVSGNSALHYAACGKSSEIIDLLLEKGLSTETKNIYGLTPLLFALQNRRGLANVDVIECLLDLGANINAKNYDGQDALHFSSNFDKPDVIECLLELGADFKAEFSPAFHDYGWERSLEILIAFMALKEDTLGDYIQSYIPHSAHYEIRRAYNFFAFCKFEIEKLKSTKMCKAGKRSFYDFLTRDFFSGFQMIKNKEVRKVFASGDYTDDFYCYSFLLFKRFTRLETLENSIDNMVDFFHGYGKFNLPILVIEKIFTLLSARDFRIFQKALSGR